MTGHKITIKKVKPKSGKAKSPYFMIISPTVDFSGRTFRTTNAAERAVLDEIRTDKRELRIRKNNPVYPSFLEINEKGILSKLRRSKYTIVEITEKPVMTIKPHITRRKSK